MVSWWLEDAQAIADEFPYTFYKASSECIAMLKVGDICKLIFAFDSDNPKDPGAERMWVKITDIQGDTYKGELDNDPYYIKDLASGEALTFDVRHIIATEHKDPVPSLVDKYIDRCLVSHMILDDKRPVGYMIHDEPLEIEREGVNDSGWIFYTDDEPKEFTDDINNFSSVSLGAVLRINDRHIDMLDKPVGTAYYWDEDRQVYVQDEEYVFTPLDDRE